MEPATDLPSSFSLRRQRPLVAEVRDELERMILSGEVAAGERLNENLLAEQMGVSRAPVREAARALEHEGLVRAVANQGVYVRDLSLSDAAELYDLRALMAGYLCWRTANSASRETKATLRALVDAMDSHISREDGERYVEANLKFHDTIAEASGAPRTAQIYSRLGKEVRLLRLRVLSLRSSWNVSNAEHKEILAAIERGDGEGARHLGAQHHLGGKERLLETA